MNTKRMNECLVTITIFIIVITLQLSVSELENFYGHLKCAQRCSRGLAKMWLSLESPAFYLACVCPTASSARPQQYFSGKV